MPSDKIKKDAADWFNTEWRKVPMGPASFIDRAWRRLIDKTDEKFGQGTGRIAADEWDRRAHDRWTAKR